MNPSFLKYMDHSGVSWDCIQCGLPNFSSTLFDNNTSINTSNRFSQLDTDTDLNTQNIPTSPGPPTASSSPIKHNKDVTRKNKFNQPIRIATINFQSISNKKPDLEQILHSLKPDIIIGTETWLNNTTSSYEYFPIQEYTVYRKDRKQNKKGQSHGGVLIAVTNKYRSEQIQELDTDNESIFINISMANSHNLTIGSYYRPPSDKGHSLDQLEISMKRLGHNNNTITFISGDFNLPHIDWQNNTTIPGKTDTKLHQQLLDIIDDNSLTQMTTNTTRGDHILDLTLTNRPSIVNKTETSPPIGKADHDIIFTEIDVRLKKIRKQPRDIPLYGKANWDNIRNDLTHINTKLDEPTNQTIDDLWNLFKNTLNDSVDKNIPKKHITYKSKLPWITKPIRQLMKNCKKLHVQNKNKQDQELKQKYKACKSELQKRTRNAYLNYIEKMIKDLPIDEQQQESPQKKKKIQPQKIILIHQNNKKREHRYHSTKKGWTPNDRHHL
ncbi:uncharacterized protein [Argopecten irradians]|uniref:uncharacterized protein n=1 Tax=Argopecten irradians TaxID=31199 RepID=UPI003717B9F4